LSSAQCSKTSIALGDEITVSTFAGITADALTIGRRWVASQCEERDPGWKDAPRSRVPALSFEFALATR
jgi:hypothetical protein